MNKILIVILAGRETHEGMGRLTNALVLAKEMKEFGYKVKVIFDGAGTEWISEITNKESKFFQLYNEVKNVIAGACGFCAAAFNVENEISTLKVLHEHMGHPSF